MQYTLKKSLGQHFLKDESICKKIVDVVDANLANHAVHQLVEVGPGGGAITKYLLQLPNINFKAVELDAEKVAFLEATYPAIQQKIIHENFLDIQAPFENQFIVVGNFPYNISSQILFKVLEWKEQVPVVIGMFQKEVAQRVAAKPNSKAYGIISVLLQAYYDVTYLFDVTPDSFTPPPKVMSGVIQLQLRNSLYNVKSDKAFVQLVKLAFNQRRKMLRNAVKSVFSAEVLQDEIFNKRAEQLSIEDFAALTFRMQ
ncbi:MAG TPA: 16S rRNA (adenine(1518)-N(6)/adenine(1519)-N(6))-dimethyltransferase RsmA [Chitinophagaceae bacterium]|jgi:16S rRNA (adenine1518-N6/adenine1519-N6)-dimethyltransferase|nr:ribosomal RNA small subunit methyltransferase A [Chitinophagaceae bacterium]MBP9740978.1 ribosomal RNA small subunit methyltransferase A [Chitinophagaceae bacterium]HPH23202.1 16S rRNA (adenine(1518)-N(6)/adenine(1519)-N(6))-dimethyltransferase RsmA [Chitinophagaceae bacterium]